MSPSQRSKFLVEALEKKGFFTVSTQEKLRQCEAFIREVKGQSTGDKEAAIDELQRLRGAGGHDN